MKRAALVSEREPKDWMAPGGRHRGHSAPLGSQGLFKLRQYAELLAQDVAARARLFNFASEGERLAVGQRAPPSSCSISNGFDAGFNLRQPVVEGSLSLAKRCAGIGAKPLFPSSAEAFAILITQRLSGCSCGRRTHLI